MKNEIVLLRKNVYRATAVIFLFQLFGALGAGFFYTIQNWFSLDHILGAVQSENESFLFFILFWTTDFFFVALTVLLSYYIAGVTALAPAASLSVFFAHFAGATQVGASEMYSAYFTTPVFNGGGVNIGWFGYLFMAVALAYIIKYLNIGWHNAKVFLGKKLDRFAAWLRTKIKALPESFDGYFIIEQVDFLMYILIIPVVAAALVFCFVRYGIQLPGEALAPKFAEALTSLSASSTVLAAIVMGLMIGFDIIGPVSMAAFAVAVSSFLAGNATLLTVYAACFVTVGWVPIGIMVLRGFIKKVPSFRLDNDDTNFATSGPINAFFENIKLTVAFTMPYACRSPLTVVPGVMLGSAATGFFTALFGIVNTAYLDLIPKNGYGQSMAELLQKGELYIAFTLPLRSGDWLHCRLPLFFIIIICGFIGGALTLALRHFAYKSQVKKGTYYEPHGDLPLEIKNQTKAMWEKFKAHEPIEVKTEGFVSNDTEFACKK